MSTETFKILPLKEIHESKLNPRKRFDKDALAELTASVREKGVIVPVIVRPNADGYELGPGHRRYRAAKAAGLTEIPALIREMDDKTFLEVLTIENLQREDVHPLEEADGFQALLDRAGYDREGIAAKIGKSVAYVHARMKLADLEKEPRDAFLKEEITAGHAVLIARLTPKDQAEALKKCFDVDGYGYMRRAGERHACSVRALGTWIQNNIHLDLAKAPWAVDDATLVPAAGSCTLCPKRTGTNPDLFPDVKKGDTCTDRTCFKAKVAAHVQSVIATLTEQGKKVARLTDEYGQVKGGVLQRREWEAAEPKKGAHVECDGITTGVFIDGARMGQTLRLCLDARCKLHRTGARVERTAGDVRSAAPSVDKKAAAREQRRRAIDEAVAVDALTAIRAKLKWPPARIDVEQFIALYLESAGGMNDALDGAMEEIYGIKGGALAPQLAKLSLSKLGALFAEIAIAGDYDAGDSIRAAAKRYRVDLKKIEKTVTAKYDLEHPVEKPAAKKKAGGKAKK